MNNNKPSNFKTIFAIIVIAFILYSCFSGGGSSSSSRSSSSKPWENLGVSQSEYMKIYNKIKYGNWFIIIGQRIL